VSGLPVLDASGKLVGIVSESDFLRRSEIGTQQKRPRWLQYFLSPAHSANDFIHERGRKVEDVMTREPVVADENTSLDELVHLMENNGIKRLPVLRDDNLVGIVTRANLLQAVASMAKEIPDPTADDEHIRDRIIRTLQPPTGGRPGFRSPCATAWFTCTVSSSTTTAHAGRRSSRRKTPRASRRCTTICALSTAGRAFTWNRLKI
jgi:CBS-domain-containing membrane protein